MWKKDKQSIRSGGDSVNIQAGRDINLVLPQLARGQTHADENNFYSENFIFETNDFIWEPGFGDASLLRPEQYAVEFHREAEDSVIELLSWAADNRKNTTLQVIIGPAGSGKTRLMLEVCRILSDKNWQAGFLRTTPPVKDDKEFNSWWHQNTSNCFLVVDYAEARPSEVVALLQSVKRNRPPYIVRIILLARNTQGWWYELMLKNRFVRIFAESNRFSGVKKIKAFGDQEKAGKSIFLQAINGYAKKLRCKVPDETQTNPPAFLKETNGEPLYIHLAAIAFLRGEKPESLNELLHFTLLRERSYWAKVLEKYDLPEAYWEGFSQAVAGITLLGGVQNDSSAIEVLNIIPKTQAFTPSEKQQVRASLSMFYKRGMGIDALRPDRLGEVLILEEYIKDQLFVDSLVNSSANRQERLTMLSILERISVNYTSTNREEIKIALNLHKDCLFRDLRPFVSRTIDRELKRSGYSSDKLLNIVKNRIEAPLKQEGLDFHFEISKLSAFDIYNKASFTSYRK